MIDTKNATCLARCRTNPPGEFRKIIGFMKPFDGLFPLIAINKIIPIWNDVTDRTALLAKRNTAIHAAGALRLQRLFRHFIVKFFPILDAFGRFLFIKILAFIFQKSCYVAHRYTFY